MGNQAEENCDDDNYAHELCPGQSTVEHDDGKYDAGETAWPEPAEKESAVDGLTATR